jgi:Tol biopolymer transport system component
MSRYGRQSISVSDDGESLLAVRGVINSSIWVSPSSDTKGARAVTSRTFGKLDGSSGLAWMPDSRIVYVSFFNNSYSLWTMNADGGDVRPLTTPGLVDRFPQATSDGRFVVFESNRGGGVDIWRVDVDGSHMRRLTTSRDNAEPALTPDGRWVLYTHRGNGTQSVWKISIDGGSAERVAPLGSSWPRVSPDGTRLAYAFLDSSSLSRGTAQLIVRSMADQTLVGQFDIARGGTTNNGIHWSPDGSAVIYRNFSGGLWKQPLSGVATKMTDVPNERIYFFDWAKDGKQFALSYGDEVRDVVLMNGFR